MGALGAGTFGVGVFGKYHGADECSVFEVDECGVGETDTLGPAPGIFAGVCEGRFFGVESEVGKWVVAEY